MLQNKEIQELQQTLKKIYQKVRIQANMPMTIEDACKYLDLKKSYMYKLTSTNKIIHYRSEGKKIYFKRSDLNKYAFKHKIKTANGILEEINANKLQKTNSKRQ